MILIKRILTILFPLLVLLNLELFVFYPEKIIVFSIILFGLVTLSIFRLINIKKKFSDFFGLVATPLFFLFSIVLVILFIESFVIRQLVVVGSAFAYAVFLEHIFRFLWQPNRYQPYALENISGALNLITIFLVVVGSFNLIILFAASHWLIILGVALVVMIMTMQTLWSSKLAIRKNWLSQFTLIFIILQLLFISYYLPLEPPIIAILVVTVYYSLINFLRHNLLGTLDREVVRRYFVIDLIVITIIILTARWT